MGEPKKQFDRVIALAHRLRLLQSDFADQPEGVRRDYLTEEVRRAIGAVPPNERKIFLAELEDYFPTWDGKVEVQPSAATSRSAFDEKELTDPSFLVKRLIEVCATLPEAQRRGVIEQLHGAGLAAVGAPDWSPAAIAEARLKLQLGPRDGVVPDRALELVSQLAEFVYSLDQVAWRTWRAIAPQSSVRRPASLQGTIARFAAGDPAVAKEQLVNELKVLRQLIAALIGTLSQTGRIALQHFRSISPDEIQVLVGPRNALVRESAYWRKYVELAGAMDSGGIEDAIRNALASFAEALIQGAWSSKT